LAIYEQELMNLPSGRYRRLKLLMFGSVMSILLCWFTVGPLSQRRTGLPPCEAARHQIEYGMSFNVVEGVLGVPHDTFPPVPYAVCTETADEPDFQEATQRFWVDETGVLELWFVSDRMVFKRYWRKITGTAWKDAMNLAKRLPRKTLFGLPLPRSLNWWLP
jgi:hypothetical protein